MTRSAVRVTGVLAILLVLAARASAWGWGAAGHALVVAGALSAGEELPAWFRGSGDALTELANAPDRWRDEEKRVPALAARAADHFFDLDVWGDEPLPPDRWAYVARAGRHRVRPEAIGFLPFSIAEEYGVLLSAFRDVQAGRAGGREGALAAAGMLAHLVGDGAVPLHVTRHHHGWVGPNPRGFTRAESVHRWFETELVDRVTRAEVRPGPDARRGVRDVPSAVQALLIGSLAEVPRLYEAERRSRVEHDDADAVALVRERLAAGATVLARLWRTAWTACDR
jgi:hypothetical protein